MLVQLRFGARRGDHHCATRSEQRVLGKPGRAQQAKLFAGPECDHDAAPECFGLFLFLVRQKCRQFEHGRHAGSVVVRAVMNLAGFLGRFARA